MIEKTEHYFLSRIYFQGCESRAIVLRYTVLLRDWFIFQIFLNCLFSESMNDIYFQAIQKKILEFYFVTTLESQMYVCGRVCEWKCIFQHINWINTSLELASDGCSCVSFKIDDKFPLIWANHERRLNQTFRFRHAKCMNFQLRTIKCVALCCLNMYLIFPFLNHNHFYIFFDIFTEVLLFFSNKKKNNRKMNSNLWNGHFSFYILNQHE